MIDKSNNPNAGNMPPANENVNPDTEASITPQELDMLDNAGDGDEDDEHLHDADLDDTDEDGVLLNEKSSADDRSGGDLDVPGSELDDADEKIGEEDEENNSYSQADTK